MKYRSLGRTGVQVSAVGIGTNQMGGVVDAAGTKAILDKALELGVNFIDTAESYSNGASEEVLGGALKGRRDQFVVATKTGGGSDPGRLTRKRIVERLEASLKRLQTDYVDVYYFHVPDRGTPLEESLRVMDDLVSAGKVRYPASSNYMAWEVAEMAAIADRRGFAQPAASQVRMSLLDRSAMAEMVPCCARFGVSLVPYSPLAGGFLTGKYPKGGALPEGARLTRVERARTATLTDENYAKLERYQAVAAKTGKPMGELAVAWLLAQPVVCSVIAGVTKPEQLDANVRAAEWTLSPEEIAALS